MSSTTGEPGGKETGQKMSHYSDEAGRFAKACATFLASKSGDPLYRLSRRQENPQEESRVQDKIQLSRLPGQRLGECNTRMPPEEREAEGQTGSISFSTPHVRVMRQNTQFPQEYRVSKLLALLED